MTTINIYENKNSEDVYILQEEFSKELDEIKKLLKDVKKQNVELKKSVLELNLIISKKTETTSEHKNNKTNSKKVSTEKVKTGTVEKESKKLKKDDKFEITAKSTKVLYKNIKLLPQGIFEHGDKKSRRKFTLRYNIYDVLYILSVSEDENFTMSDFKKIYEENKEWNRIDLFKLIYNLRNNKKMMKLISDARDVLVKDMTFTKKNDILYINGVNTEIPVHQARDICNVYINSNKSRDVYIWELQKKLNKLNPDYLAILIYNQSNNMLIDVLKREKNTFVENNPSKRRNLIMNGGLI